jgi:membrane protease YdiL (CAAX protease family)
MELANTRGQATGPTNHVVQLMRQHPLLFYFLIAYAFSWTYEVLVFGVLHTPINALWLINALWNMPLSLGPTLAAFLMTAVMQGRAGIVQLLRRYVLWRVGIPWYLLVLPGVLVLMLLTYLLLPGAFSAFRPLALASPGYWLPFLIVYVVVLIAGGPLGEEPGWRGFALPRLEQRSGPLVGTLVLGVLWGLWHLPLLLLVPANQPGFTGTGGTGFFNTLVSIVMFVIMVMAMAYVFTWVFNNTRGSLLLAILLHATINTASIMLPYLFRPLPQTGSLLFGLGQLLVWVVLAVLIITTTRGRLSYQRYQREMAGPSPVTDREREQGEVRTSV